MIRSYYRNQINSQWAEKLRDVSDSDSFPHQVCNNCIQNISGAYFYRLQCYKANSLLQRLSDILNKPISSPQSDTMKSSTSDFEIKETFNFDEMNQDVEKKSIASYFIELSQDNTELSEPDQIDYKSIDVEKKMNVEVQGIQYQIESKMFQVDIEEDESEQIKFTEVDDESVKASESLKSENIEEEDELKSSNVLLKEIKIEFLDSNTEEPNENMQSITKSFKIRPKNEKKKSIIIEDDYRCELCDAKFTKLQSLKRHVKIHQADQRNKLCSFCGKAFIRADDLTRHVRTHTGERPYACKLCPKRYKQSSELNEHLLTHSKEKKFICSICGNALQTRNGYYVHMLIHRGEKKHRCEKCGNRYVTSGELNSHIRHIHDKVKPFRCSIGECNRCFTTKHSLEIHQRAHTGERPFKCTFCTKCFSAKSSLQDHIRIHIGTNPYKCEICNKTVNSHQGLRKHMQGHETRGEMENKQYPTDTTYIEMISNS